MPFAKDGIKCRCQKPWYKAGIYRDGYKCPKHIHPYDARLRAIFPRGMRDEIDIKMEFSIGFEKFGSYEDWGQGWTIEGTVNGKRIYMAGNYIDMTMERWLTAAEKVKNPE